MNANAAFPPVHEPFARTLARNLAIATSIGVVLTLARGRPALLPLNVSVALWPSLGGHYVEILFLNVIRQHIPPAGHRLARLALWFAAGLALYGCMLATLRLLGSRGLRPEWWWLGGLAFIGIESLAHVALLLRRLPNFYRGDG